MDTSKLRESRRLLDMAAAARAEHDKLGGTTALPSDDPQALGDFLSEHLTAFNLRLTHLEAILHELVKGLEEDEHRRRLEKRRR